MAPETDAPGETATFPPGDADAVPDAQHEWSEYLIHDSAGNTVPPQHQLILGLSYEGSEPPTEAERERVAAAFDALDRAFQWGTGGDPEATFNRGLLDLVGYAPRYFERFGVVPNGLVRPAEVLERVGEDPAKTDGFDAVVVLTSDVGSVVLAAEQALLGERDRVNGVRIDPSNSVWTHPMVWRGQPGNDTFEWVNASAHGMDEVDGRCMASLDYDGDGDRDVVFSTGGGHPVLFENAVDEGSAMQFEIVDDDGR